MTKKSGDTKNATVSTELRDLLKLIPTAPKVVGTLSLPSGSRFGHYILQIEIDRSRDQDLATLAKLTKHKSPMVVAVLVEVGSTTEAARWERLGANMPVPKNGDGPPPNECNIHRLLDITGLTKQRASQLTHQGTFVRLTRGRYDLDASVKGYIEELRAEARGRGGQEYSAERTLDKREQRLIRELERLERAQKLVDVDEVKAKALDMGLRFRKAVEGLIPRLSRRLVSATTQTKVRTILKSEINSMLKTLALNGNGNGRTRKKG